jgi:hypothetical protein
MHGWGLSLKLREISRDVFDVNQGFALSRASIHAPTRMDQGLSGARARTTVAHATTPLPPKDASSSTPRWTSGTARPPR